MTLTIVEALPIRVLLVEDECLVSEMVAESLARQGFCVHTATSGTEALQHLASAPVDVLFTDIALDGGMDGTALAQRARSLLPDLPVVYASGGMQMFDVAARVPHSIFVAKPYDPDVVGRVLRRAIGTGAGEAAGLERNRFRLNRLAL